MTQATFLRDSDDIRMTAQAAVVTGDLFQLPDGRAAYYTGSAAAIDDSDLPFKATDQVIVPKTSGIAILDGGRVYWDRSAAAAHFKPVNDRDFYIGRAVGDAAPADTQMTVNLNVNPNYDIDVQRDGMISVFVGTAAAGAFGYPVKLGGTEVLELTATNEAQKVDLLSVKGFSKSAKAVIECIFRVISDGAGTVVDFSIGAATGTHASDASAITERLFIHLDANNVNINAESSDGTTTVAITDTTKDYTEGSGYASQVEVWFDMRSSTDIQIYVDGVNVLPSAVFSLDAAAGPLQLLAHLEKTISTDTYKIAVDRLCARFCEQRG